MSTNQKVGSLILGSFSLHVKNERDAELQVAPDSFVLSIELKICIGNVNLSWQVVPYCQNQHVSKGTTFTLKVNSRHLLSSSHSSQFHCCTTCNCSNLIQTKATTEVFSGAPYTSFGRFHLATAGNRSEIHVFHVHFFCKFRHFDTGSVEIFRSQHQVATTAVFKT